MRYMSIDDADFGIYTKLSGFHIATVSNVLTITYNWPRSYTS